MRMYGISAPRHSTALADFDCFSEQNSLYCKGEFCHFLMARFQKVNTSNKILARYFMQILNHTPVSPWSKVFKTGGFCLLAFFLLVENASARQRYLKSCTVEVKGSSNLHDWQARSNSLKSDIFIAGDELSSAVKSVKGGFSIPVQSLKSGKSGLDEKMYDALKYQEFNAITFKLSSAKMSGPAKVQLSGSLFVAGNSRKVNIDVKADSINLPAHVKGKVALKMSDFNIDPPTALLGAVRAYNEIDISFQCSID